MPSEGPAKKRRRVVYILKHPSRYAAYENWLERIARAVEPLLDAPPPGLRLGSAGSVWRALRAAFSLGRDLPGALRLLLGAARPLLEEFFESEPLRATLRSYAQTPGKGDLAAKQNSFVVRYGQAAKADVADFFGQLGYPIAPETKEALKGFPAFRYVPAAPAT